jgi:hypothetical protein
MSENANLVDWGLHVCCAPAHPERPFALGETRAPRRPTPRRDGPKEETPTMVLQDIVMAVEGRHRPAGRDHGAA